jgi:hypothetical protein
MFKKLLPLLFLFAGFQANAALFQFQFEDTISSTTISGLSGGQSALVTVALDNGGTSLISQTWTAFDLQSLTFDFNDGGVVSTFSAPFDGGIDYVGGDFETDAAGTLTSVMSDWSDYGITSDFVNSGSAAVSFQYELYGGSSTVYWSDVGYVELDNGSHGPESFLQPDQWSQVSVVPEPSIIALFGLGLAGLGFARRRRQA